MGSESPVSNIADWPEVSLLEITTKIGSGSTPRGGAETYLPCRMHFALVRSQNVFDRRFDSDGLVFISDEQARDLRGVMLQPSDILLNITGDGVTFGRSCIVPSDVHPACVNQHVSIIRVDPKRAIPGYVLSFLTHPVVKRYIESFNAGGSRRAITKGHIESFRLPLPSLPEQSAIAHILGSLDDKIELNRRMNATLEAMAQALFKSWFVDFDPVRAKAAGKAPPGLAPKIAALFPDRFQDSELGEIPEGWTVSSLGDIAENPRRSVQPREIEPSTPYIALEHMPRHCIALSEWGTSESLESDKLAFKRGAFLFGKLRPYFHKVGVAPLDGVCSTDIVVVTPKTESWFGFVLGHISSDVFVDYTSAGSTGTRMPRTSWNEMARYRVVVPNESIGKAFTLHVRHAISRMGVSIQESRILASLRDTLLTKLISGELRVPGRRLPAGMEA
jgi:type I restriction enzyme S subunit